MNSAALVGSSALDAQTQTRVSYLQIANKIVDNIIKIKSLFVEERSIWLVQYLECESGCFLSGGIVCMCGLLSEIYKQPYVCQLLCEGSELRTR